jgi:hypothetical protein
MIFITQDKQRNQHYPPPPDHHQPTRQPTSATDYDAVFSFVQDLEIIITLSKTTNE